MGRKGARSSDTESSPDPLSSSMVVPVYEENENCTISSNRIKAKQLEMAYVTPTAKTREMKHRRRKRKKQQLKRKVLICRKQ